MLHHLRHETSNSRRWHCLVSGGPKVYNEDQELLGPQCGWQMSIFCCRPPHQLQNLAGQQYKLQKAAGLPQARARMQRPRRQGKGGSGPGSGP